MNERTLHIILPPVPGLLPGDQPLYEFHISADCRARYAVDEHLFTLSGNAVLVNYRAAQNLAESSNKTRDARNHPELALRAGQLQVMGLVDEFFISSKAENAWDRLRQIDDRLVSERGTIRERILQVNAQHVERAKRNVVLLRHFALDKELPVVE